MAGLEPAGRQAGKQAGEALSALHPQSVILPTPRAAGLGSHRSPSSLAVAAPFTPPARLGPLQDPVLPRFLFCLLYLSFGLASSEVTFQPGLAV